MYDTTKTCVGSPWPDASVGTHGEYERGFLLPQLMGALASEIGGIGLREICQWPTNRDAKESGVHLWLDTMPQASGNV
ncbi:MAG: hypothetical protein JWP80_388 [Pseudomonas sp.]|nr:hypothetical protein [Pseudomonas sp.]